MTPLPLEQLLKRPAQTDPTSCDELRAALKECARIAEEAGNERPRMRYALEYIQATANAVLERQEALKP